MDSNHDGRINAQISMYFDTQPEKQSTGMTRSKTTPNLLNASNRHDSDDLTPHHFESYSTQERSLELSMQNCSDTDNHFYHISKYTCKIQGRWIAWC